MIITPTKIPDAYLLRREPFADERGTFDRIFCKQQLEAAGIRAGIAQVNLSANYQKGTLRGLHAQKGEFAEDKLVACLRGAIFDVCVDVREDSAAFGQWVGATLSGENGVMLYIPKGCAHGYLTLTDDTQVLYFVTQFYTPGAEVGYRFDDPAFGIAWPLAAPYRMSDKDRNWPLTLKGE
jgi:dTDP-4-dehydrorhamnose 3,5-epimerase